GRARGRCRAGAAAPAGLHVRAKQAGIFAAGAGAFYSAKSLPVGGWRGPRGQPAARLGKPGAYRPTPKPDRQVPLGPGPGPGRNQPSRLHQRLERLAHRPQRGRAPPALRVGADVPLSGAGTQSTSGTSSASNLAGDVSLEYTLLADGRLRLRAFRQNAYEDIDGAIVRTGAALVFQRDYNNFKDLFEKVSKADKRQNRETRKQDKLDKEEQKRREQQQADSAPLASKGAASCWPPNRLKNIRHAERSRVEAALPMN
nr:hypothetical protein [Tanacetum cinerariifolium]